ncbi:ABC transporter ATP-binding protein [Peptostreptococcus equinus]|uniref:ABC transporter ATP-binding protein n=1 Tax=Peptostreptococcus equinus TaxID=3003601 RepID=A0ABY7JMB3_9FIRM|nr:ABC transporter ATP-binding protein [Peptostreptococcus sp. CBA3647]WAW14501.1 ABC transporter ATP-binding protein [Peptostreptococcus sp. CBA3647]
MAYVELINIGKVYDKGENKFNALKNINLKINEGEFVVIMGPSGSGKTTLLNIIAGIDTPTSGSILINEIDLKDKNKSSLARYRRRDIGIIFQQYNLIRVLTVRENIELQVRLDNKKPDKEDVDNLMDSIGLKKLENKFPDQLSGGEQQRVAIARALAANPILLLADEPTGNLDSKTSNEILKIIKNISRNNKQTIIMITHDINVADYADRIINIKDGQII